VIRVRPAALAIVAGLALAFAAARLAPLRTPPLYDGVVPDQPYVWLDPPPGHPGNPKGNTATVAVSGSRSPLVTLDTLELNPQAQLFAPPGALNLPAGTTSITISIEPVEPQSLPTDGHIDGNVYRIKIVNQAGAAATADPTADVTVVLRATDPTTSAATIELYANGVWTPLKTDPEGFGAQFLSIVSGFGDFAVVLPGAAPSGGATSTGTPVGSGPASSSPAVPSPAAPSPAASGEGSAGSPGGNVTLYAGVAIVVILLALAATALLPGRNGRNRNRNRGWSDRPPPRARR
jgi:hypothetical protein